MNCRRRASTCACFTFHARIPTLRACHVAALVHVPLAKGLVFVCVCHAPVLAVPGLMCPSYSHNYQSVHTMSITLQGHKRHGSSALPVEKLPLATNQVLNSLWSSMHAAEAALVAEPLLGFKAPTATWDQFQLEDPIKGEAWKTSQLERPRDDGMWACNWRYMQPTACCTVMRCKQPIMPPLVLFAQLHIMWRHLHYTLSRK